MFVSHVEGATHRDGAALVGLDRVRLSSMLLEGALLSVLLVSALPAEGDVVRVKVTAVSEVGCYVAHKDGWEAFLHIDNLAWERVFEAKKYCKRGQALNVMVMRVGERISVSRKALQPDPWIGAAKRFPVGKKLRAKVIFAWFERGVVVELASGVEGALYLVDLPEQFTKWPREGRRVEVVVREVSEADRSIRVVLAHPPPAAARSRAEALDALRTDLLPNLTASLAVLEPMAQAGKVDERERMLAVAMAALVSERVEQICAAGAPKPSAADCAAARAAASAMEAALVTPTAQGMAQAERDCALVRTAAASW